MFCRRGKREDEGFRCWSWRIVCPHGRMCMSERKGVAEGGVNNAMLARCEEIFALASTTDLNSRRSVNTYKLGRASGHPAQQAVC